MARRSIAIVALCLAGCGAKTGLYVPDADAQAPPDVMDAGILDAGPDVDICVEVPLDGGPIQVELEVEAEVGSADITFLIDVTASMGEEIDRIRSRLRDQLSPAIDEAIPDSQLAVATFADFPVRGYGNAGAGDNPFELRLPMTTDLSQVQAAVNAINLGDGADIQESQVEALFQLATGAGRGTYVPPAAGCPMGGVGYACMRRDAFPIVLLFTDADFHNGPRGAFPYSTGDIVPAPATYDQAVAALNALGMVVIGFDSGEGAASDHLRAVARDTGAIADGRPLVFDIGSRGQRLGTQVVSAIQTFASSVEQDIDAIFLDGDPSDGLDATDFVESVRPVRADPADGVSEIDFEAGVFRDARAGTVLTWEITVFNDAVVPGPTARRVRLEIIFRGDARRRLKRIFVDIVIPGEDGSGCEELF